MARLLLAQVGHDRSDASTATSSQVQRVPYQSYLYLCNFLKRVSRAGTHRDRCRFAKRSVRRFFHVPASRPNSAQMASPRSSRMCRATERAGASYDRARHAHASCGRSAPRARASPVTYEERCGYHFQNPPEDACSLIALSGPPAQNISRTRLNRILRAPHHKFHEVAGLNAR